MFSRAYRRMCSRKGALLWPLLIAGALLLVLSPSPSVTITARFPHLSPRTLAHLLADFSTHTRLYPHLGEWQIEEERSNYTSWHYTVSYTCGARCTGRARVLAVDVHAGPPEHVPRAHRVLVAHTSCTKPWLLPWPASCEQWTTDTLIESDGSDGAVMSVEARGGGCGGWGAARALLPGSCAAELRARTEQRLANLRAISQEK